MSDITKDGNKEDKNDELITVQDVESTTAENSETSEKEGNFIENNESALKNDSNNEGSDEKTNTEIENKYLKQVQNVLSNKKAVVAIIGALLLIILGIGIFMTPSNRASRQLSLGEKYLLNEQFDEAIIAFEKVLKIDPNIVDAYVGLSKAYESKEDLNKAIQILEQGYEITKDASLEKQKTEKISELNQKNNQSETADANDVENKDETTDINSDAVELMDKNEEEEMMRLLEKQSNMIFGIAYQFDFDSQNFNPNDQYFWITLLFFGYDVGGNFPIRLSGNQSIEGEILYPTQEVDWIFKNIFNIQEDYLSDINFEKTDDVFADFIVRNNDFYHMCVNGICCDGVNREKVVKYTKNNDQSYDVEILLDSWGTMYTVNVNAYVKEYDNQKYWSFNTISKVQEYNGDPNSILNDTIDNTSTLSNGILEDQQIIDELIRLEEATDERYKSLKSESINLVGYVSKEYFDSEYNGGLTAHDYMAINFDEPVEMEINYFGDDSVYTATYNQIPIVWFEQDGRFNNFENKKIAIRGKGIDSAFGGLSTKLVIGAYIELD